MKRTGLLTLFLLLLYNARAQQNILTQKEKRAGWQLLFDGKTTRGWKGAFSTGFPTTGWKIKDGQLCVESSAGKESANGGDIVTLTDYSDFELLVDFKLTAGANSGIKYFVDAAQPVPADPRSAFGLEFQVLDDERHPDAKLGKSGNRTIGSLYDLIPAIYNKPARAVGQWNTARIVSKGTNVEHWLNGVMVVAYDRGSDAFKTIVAGSKYKAIAGFGLQPNGRILLQDHGNEVCYRNIKIRMLKNEKSNGLSRLQEKLGLVSYTYRNSFSANAAATLDSIKALGITNMEFSNLFGKTAAELKALLDERGMKCTSFGVSYSDLVNKTGEVARNAKALGASFVRVAWIPHENVPFDIAVVKKAVADFNAAGKVLKEDYGLTFCYHNHGYEFQSYGGGTYYDYMMAHTNPKYVSFEMDILWVVHPGADPVALLKKYGARYKLMHLKDLRRGVAGDFSGGTDVNNDVALGSGAINIAAVLKAAQTTGIKYYYIEDESSHVNLQVPVSNAYVKGLWQ